MMSALKHYLDQPGKRLVYCADLSLPGQSPYYVTLITTFDSYYAQGFARSISPAHPIVYVTTAAAGQPAFPNRPMPPLLSYWLKHHFLARRTTTFHDAEVFSPDGSIMMPATVYVWKHAAPKGLGGIATIRESTGKPMQGFNPGFYSKNVQVPWVNSFCGGRVKPVRIVNFTKPTASDGATVSRVTIDFSVRDLPSWLYAKPVQAVLGRVAPHKVMTRTLLMTQTSDGWSVLNVIPLVPLVTTHRVASFRSMMGAGGF